MWNKVLGLSNEKRQDPPATTSRRKDDEKRSDRKRTSSTVSSNSTKKPSSTDEYNRGINPTSTSYSSTSRTAQPGAASASVASSYATASSKNLDETVYPPHLVRNASLADQMPKSKSGRDELDGGEGRDAQSERRKNRSASQDRKGSRQDLSRSGDREDRKRERREKRERRRENDGGKERGLSNDGDDQGTSRAGDSITGGGNFNVQVGSSTFTQFPGQFDATLPGIPGGLPSIPHMSDHVPDQFPGQFPSGISAPYHPPLSVDQGGPGLAADYYGDAGESVAHQPGVRPQAPTLIVGAQPHLMAASPIEAPPLEPSATGEVGAAASFFSGATFQSPSASPQPSQPSKPPSKPAVGASGQPSYSGTSNNFAVPSALVSGAAPSYMVSGHGETSQSQAPPPNNTIPFRPLNSAVPPSSGYSSSSILPTNTFHSGSAPIIPTLGSAALGAAAGYMMGSHESQQQPSHPPMPTQGPALDFQRPQSQIEASHESISGYGRPPQAGKPPSSSSNIPLYAAGAVGAAGLAAAAYHHNHQDSTQNSYNGNTQPTGFMPQRHRHSGPLSKFVDFFRDSEAVAQYEEYTEYIGVCRYCFQPGSSPREAPRKHYYRRKRSNESLGGSSRIDKESRYGYADNDRRRRNNNNNSSWIATGIAGLGLAEVGKTLFSTNREFDNASSIRPGHPSEPNAPLDRRRYSNSPERKSYTSYGVTDNQPTYNNRPHSRPRSRDRQTGIPEALMGAAIGSTIAASSSQRPSKSPKGAFLRDEPRSGEREERRRKEKARISPPSSCIEVHRPAESSKQRSSGHKKKKQSGYFNFGNASSSSADSALVIGTGSDRSRRKKSTKPRIKDHNDANAALIGLGAAAAALAAVESRKNDKGKRRADVVAVKEVRTRNGRGSDQKRAGDPQLIGSRVEELWVSASEENGYSSVDSTLAYGVHRRRSNDSLRSNSSGTNKWGWRWGSSGSKKKKDKRREESHYPEVVVAAAGIAGVAAEAAVYAREESQATAHPPNETLPPLQHVFPMATSDPSHYDVARYEPVASLNYPLTSRPATIPLQQPQPYMPVSSAVYTSQAPYDQSYSVSAGPPVFSQPQQSSSHGINYDSRPHQRDAASVAKIASIETRPLKRVSTRDEESSVRFDAVAEQEDRERKERKERRRERKRLAALEEVAGEQDSKGRTGTDEKGRSPKKNSKYDMEPQREAEISNELELRHEEEEVLSKQNSPHSLVKPALAGIAGVVVGAAVAEEISRKDQRVDRRKEGKSKNKEVEQLYESEQGQRYPSNEVSEQTSQEERQNALAKKAAALVKKAPSPVHEDYSSFFAPTEFLSKSADKQIDDSNGGNDITSHSVPQIITIEPSDQHGPPSAVPYLFPGHEEEGSFDPNMMKLPWQVPRLMLIKPTPPASMAGSVSGSVRGDASPVIYPVDAHESDAEIPEKSSSRAKVTFGDSETREYEVVTPEDHREEFIDDSAASQHRETALHMNAAQPDLSSVSGAGGTPVEETTKDRSPGEFGDDIDFTATLAAGLEESGFDPNIVINDPTYRRRTSPPGSDRLENFKSPHSEIPEDHTAESGTPSIPRDEPKKKVLVPLSSESKRIEKDNTTRELSEVTEPEIIEVTPRKMRENFTTSQTGNEQNDKKSPLGANVEENQFYDALDSVSDKSPDKDIYVIPEDLDRVSTSRDDDDLDDFVESYTTSKRGKELPEEHQNRDANYDIASAISSSPTFSKTPETNGKLKKENTGGLFSIVGLMTGKAKDQSSEFEREIPTEARLEDFEEPKRKTKRSKDPKSKRNSNGVSNDREVEESGTSTLAKKRNIKVEEDDLSPNNLDGVNVGRYTAKSNQVEQPLSFLGVRRKITEPPDIVPNAYPEHDSGYHSNQRPVKALPSPVMNETGLPALPPSRPSTPTEVGSLRDLPQLPPSRPGSPTASPIEPRRRLSMLQSFDFTNLKSSPSPTAVPLMFRRFPSAIGVNRSSPSSPASPRSMVGFSPRQRRPLSTEFKSSTEFRPLWLVERHNPARRRASEDEVYPSLPSSHTTSRASSVHDADTDEHVNHDENQQRIQPTREPSSAIVTQEDYMHELLGSQQATPTRATFFAEPETEAEGYDALLRARYGDDMYNQGIDQNLMSLSYDRGHPDEPTFSPRSTDQFSHEKQRSRDIATTPEIVTGSALLAGAAAIALRSMSPTGTHQLQEPIFEGEEVKGNNALDIADRDSAIAMSSTPLSEAEHFESIGHKKEGDERQRENKKELSEVSELSNHSLLSERIMGGTEEYASTEKPRGVDLELEESIDRTRFALPPTRNGKKNKKGKGRSRGLERSRTLDETEATSENVSAEPNDNEVVAPGKDTEKILYQDAPQLEDRLTLDQGKASSEIFSEVTTIYTGDEPGRFGLIEQTTLAEDLKEEEGQTSGTKSRKSKKQKGKKGASVFENKPSSTPQDELVREIPSETPCDTVDLDHIEDQDYNLSSKKGKKGKKGKNRKALDRTTIDPVVEAVTEKANATPPENGMPSPLSGARDANRQVNEESLELGQPAYLPKSVSTTQNNPEDVALPSEDDLEFLPSLPVSPATTREPSVERRISPEDTALPFDDDLDLLDILPALPVLVATSDQGRDQDTVGELSAHLNEEAGILEGGRSRALSDEQLQGRGLGLGTGLLLEREVGLDGTLSGELEYGLDGLHTNDLADTGRSVTQAIRVSDSEAEENQPSRLGEFTQYEETYPGGSFAAKPEEVNALPLSTERNEGKDKVLYQATELNQFLQPQTEDVSDIKDFAGSEEAHKIVGTNDRGLLVGMKDDFETTTSEQPYAATDTAQVVGSILKSEGVDPIENTSDRGTSENAEASTQDEFQDMTEKPLQEEDWGLPIRSKGKKGKKSKSSMGKKLPVTPALEDNKRIDNISMAPVEEYTTTATNRNAQETRDLPDVEEPPAAFSDGQFNRPEGFDLSEQPEPITAVEEPPQDDEWGFPAKTKGKKGRKLKTPKQELRSADTASKEKQQADVLSLAATDTGAEVQNMLTADEIPITKTSMQDKGIDDDGNFGVSTRQKGKKGKTIDRARATDSSTFEAMSDTLPVAKKPYSLEDEATIAAVDLFGMPKSKKDKKGRRKLLSQSVSNDHDPERSIDIIPEHGTEPELSHERAPGFLFGDAMISEATGVALPEDNAEDFVDEDPSITLPVATLPQNTRELSLDALPNEPSRFALPTYEDEDLFDQDEKIEKSVPEVEPSSDPPSIHEDRDLDLEQDSLSHHQTMLNEAAYLPLPQDDPDDFPGADDYTEELMPDMKATQHGPASMHTDGTHDLERTTVSRPLSRALDNSELLHDTQGPPREVAESIFTGPQDLADTVNLPHNDHPATIGETPLVSEQLHSNTVDMQPTFDLDQVALNDALLKTIGQSESLTGSSALGKEITDEHIIEEFKEDDGMSFSKKKGKKNKNKSKSAASDRDTVPTPDPYNERLLLPTDEPSETSREASGPSSTMGESAEAFDDANNFSSKTGRKGKKKKKSSAFDWNDDQVFNEAQNAAVAQPEGLLEATREIDPVPEETVDVADDDASYSSKRVTQGQGNEGSAAVDRDANSVSEGIQASVEARPIGPLEESREVVVAGTAPERLHTVPYEDEEFSGFEDKKPLPKSHWHEDPVPAGHEESSILEPISTPDTSLTIAEPASIGESSVGALTEPPTITTALATSMEKLDMVNDDTEVYSLKKSRKGKKKKNTAEFGWSEEPTPARTREVSPVPPAEIAEFTQEAIDPAVGDKVPASIPRAGTDSFASKKSKGKRKNKKFATLDLDEDSNPTRTREGSPLPIVGEAGTSRDVAEPLPIPAESPATIDDDNAEIISSKKGKKDRKKKKSMLDWSEEGTPTRTREASPLPISELQDFPREIAEQGAVPDDMTASVEDEQAEFSSVDKSGRDKKKKLNKLDEGEAVAGPINDEEAFTGKPLESPSTTREMVEPFPEDHPTLEVRQENATLERAQDLLYQSDVPSALSRNNLEYSTINEISARLEKHDKAAVFGSSQNEDDEKKRKGSSFNWEEEPIVDSLAGPSITNPISAFEESAEPSTAAGHPLNPVEEDEDAQYLFSKKSRRDEKKQKSALNREAETDVEIASPLVGDSQAFAPVEVPRHTAEPVMSVEAAAAKELGGSAEYSVTKEVKKDKKKGRKSETFEWSDEPFKTMATAAEETLAAPIESKVPQAFPDASEETRSVGEESLPIEEDSYSLKRGRKDKRKNKKGAPMLMDQMPNPPESLISPENLVDDGVFMSISDHPKMPQQLATLISEAPQQDAPQERETSSNRHLQRGPIPETEPEYLEGIPSQTPLPGIPWQQEPHQKSEPELAVLMDSMEAEQDDIFMPFESTKKKKKSKLSRQPSPSGPVSQGPSISLPEEVPSSLPIAKTSREIELSEPQSKDPFEHAANDLTSFADERGTATGSNSLQDSQYDQPQSKSTPDTTFDDDSSGFAKKTRGKKGKKFKQLDVDLDSEAPTPSPREGSIAPKELAGTSTDLEAFEDNRDLSALQNPVQLPNEQPTPAQEDDWGGFGTTKRKKGKRAKNQSLAVWEDDTATSRQAESFENTEIEKTVPQSLEARPEMQYDPDQQELVLQRDTPQPENDFQTTNKEALNLPANESETIKMLEQKNEDQHGQALELQESSKSLEQPFLEAEQVPDDSWDIPITKKGKKGKRAKKQFLNLKEDLPSNDPPSSQSISGEDRSTVKSSEPALNNTGEPSSDHVENIRHTSIDRNIRDREMSRSKTILSPASAAGAATAVGAGIALFEGLHRRSSVTETNKGQKVKTRIASTDSQEHERGGSLQKQVSEPHNRDPVLQETIDDRVSMHVDEHEIEGQEALYPEAYSVQRDFAANRDSAIHVADSPLAGAKSPVHFSVRDSGYQGIETSPTLPEVLALQRPDRFSGDSYTRNTDRGLTSQRDSGADTFDNTNRSSLENPLNISIEVDPAYDVSISRPDDDYEFAMTTSKAADRQREAPNQRSANRRADSNSPVRAGQLPSPVESTTRDRSSVLFQSSPSTREDIVVDHDRSRDAIESHASSRPVGGQGITAPITTESHKDTTGSLFGGPIGINSDLQSLVSPPRTPLSGRRQLNTIDEYDLGESPLLRKSRDVSDVGLPEHGLRATRRSAAPQGLSHQRLRSPLAEAARELGPISTDDIISRLSWPAVDEDTHSVDLERSKSRNTDQGQRSSRRQSPLPALAADSIKQHEGDYRSVSGASVRSGESINAIIRSPGFQSPGTPPLRRVDRSVSNDLRAANKRIEANNSAKLAETDLDAELVIPSSSTYDPTTDKGKARITKMTDVYEGWGDVHDSSRSPTRPPSMRKRQSMQLLDLETRIDQLVSENRSLQDAKARADRQLDEAVHDHSQQITALSAGIQTRDLYLEHKNSELTELKSILEGLQNEVSRLSEVNEGLSGSKRDISDHEERYSQLENDHAEVHQRWQESTRELEDLKQQHASLSGGMEGIVRHEVELALDGKNGELRQMQEELEVAKQQIRKLQQQILAQRASDDVLVVRDEDYFDGQCQQLCQHVQQWVLRFSKFSDMKPCRSINEIADEKISDRFDNAILDGSDVDTYLADRIKRRDVFMSVVMTMVWEYIFTRYLFGMDREQRQKLKSLEKVLSEVGPAKAVNKWRATTLTMLARREAFVAQRQQDTDAVVHEIYDTLAVFLPPPDHLVSQITESLRKVLLAAVDLSIEMRTQPAEYVMLPPLQPEYDVNGDLARKVYFNASVMNERSGDTTSNEDLVGRQAVVRMVLFPLVVKQGDDDGVGDDKIVVCPAQVLVAREEPARGNKGKTVRVMSAQSDRMEGLSMGNQSVHSFAPSSMEAGTGNRF